MDINLLFTLGVMVVTVTAFVVTTSVLVNVTRADFKDFKVLVETRFTAVDGKFTGIESRLNRLEVDVAEIKAICRERTGRDTPV
jgi:hypothetical protein